MFTLQLLLLLWPVLGSTSARQLSLLLRGKGKRFSSIAIRRFNVFSLSMSVPRAGRVLVNLPFAGHSPQLQRSTCWCVKPRGFN